MLSPALLALEANIEAWWAEEREGRFVDAAGGVDVAIEISNRYRLPAIDSLQGARGRGALLAG